MYKLKLAAPICIAASLFFVAGTTAASDKEAFGLQIAKDINPDPKIMEINLEARIDYVEIKPGIFSQVYSYNGVVPGPLIKAKVGDTLIVHFTNSLPEPTTIHWHGIRLPADMDGASVAQNPIQPGQTFRYEFVLKDASMFWYHPHVRSNEQVEKGLAGAILVEPNDNQLDNSAALDQLSNLKQRILVLDDILLDKNGQIEDAFTGTGKEILLKKINGRTGNTMLVNGRELPTMKVKSGVPLRWRMVNVANTRFMNIEVPGHTLTRIGGDGGLLESPITGLNTIKIVSGERADIVFTPVGAPGTELIVYWKDVVRGRHTIDIIPNPDPTKMDTVIMGKDPMDGSYPDIPLMKLVFKKGKAKALQLPRQLRTITPIDITGATESTFNFDHSMPMANGMIKFLINGKTFAEMTSADAPDASVGETQVWNLANMSGGDHPFHLHGFFFQVLETIQKDAAGNIIKIIPAPPMEDKDVVNLPRSPSGEGSVTIVKIAIKFDPAQGLSANDIMANGGVANIINADLDNGQRGHSGGWQFHCHILEHADTGMMSFVEIWN
ncbi:MAG: multicopper oxidase family protein [Thiohalomonadales bacterium]